MTEHDALDRRLTDWMRETATAPHAADQSYRAVTAATRARPLQRWRAPFGSDWVGASSFGHPGLASSLGRGSLAVLLVLGLLLAAAIAGALLAGAHPTRPPLWGLGDLAYSDGDIYVAGADGSSPVRIAKGSSTGGPQFSQPRWSPDGRYVLYAADDSGVVVTDPAGNRLGSFVGQDPMWASDSSRIATVSVDSSTADQNPASFSLEVHAVDGRLLQHVAIPDVPGGYRELAWSPDGEAIVALPWLVPLDGSPARAFTTGVAAPGSDAAFSPDGSKVAIVATYGLYLVAPDGTGGRLLAPNQQGSDGYANPVWSPDGDRIAVLKRGVGDRSGAGLEVVDIATGDVSEIVPVSHSWVIPRWSPDGRRLLASVSRAPGLDALASVAADGSGDEAVLVNAPISFGADWQWIRTSSPGRTPSR